MGKSKIEWCDETFNPITGCHHDCEYCYARQMTRRFSGNFRQNVMKTDKYIKTDEGLYILDKPFLDDNGQQIMYPFGFHPTYHRYRLNSLDKLKMGHNIFVGAMADMFGEWVPDEWVEEVIAVCRQAPQHNYMFLTKNPKRYGELTMSRKLPERNNFWYGSTITDPNSAFWWSDYHHTFVSIEPILESFEQSCREAVKKVDWIIIGAETGKRKEKVIPEKEWIDNIWGDAVTAGIPVFMKDSLAPIIGEENMIKEFPAQLKIRKRSRKVHERLTRECMMCGEESDKSTMVSLYARVGRGGRMKTISALCKKCYREFCVENSINGYEEELYGETKKLSEDGRTEQKS